MRISGFVWRLLGEGKLKRNKIRVNGPRAAKIRCAKNEWSENLREAKFEKNKVTHFHP